jgi:hypothetical protein
MAALHARRRSGEGEQRHRSRSQRLDPRCRPPDLLLVCAGNADAGRGEKDCAAVAARPRAQRGIGGGISLGAYALAHAGSSTAAAARCTGKTWPRSPSNFPDPTTTGHLRHRRRPLHVLRRHRRSRHDAGADHRRDGRSLANDVSSNLSIRAFAERATSNGWPSRAGSGSPTKSSSRRSTSWKSRQKRRAKSRHRRARVAVDATARAALREVPAQEPESLLPRITARLRPGTAAGDHEAHSRCRGRVRFASASHFSRCYRMVYGHRPSAERRPRRRRVGTSTRAAAAARACSRNPSAPA